MRRLVVGACGVLVGLLAVGMSGCHEQPVAPPTANTAETSASPVPPPTPSPDRLLTADEAWNQYAELASEIADGLQAAHPRFDWIIEEPVFDTSADRCILDLGSIYSDSALPMDSGGFDKAREILDPILEHHKFSPLGKEHTDNAQMTFVETENAERVTFRLETRNYTSLDFPTIRVDNSTCPFDAVESGTSTDPKDGGKLSMRSTTTAPQGSQPRFGTARVGIVRASLDDGVGHVQLSIRTPTSGWTVIVEQGEPIELPDGVLTVERVEAEPGSTQGRVTFVFETDDDAE